MKALEERVALLESTHRSSQQNQYKQVAVDRKESFVDDYQDVKLVQKFTTNSSVTTAGARGNNAAAENIAYMEGLEVSEVSEL